MVCMCVHVSVLCVHVYVCVRGVLYVQVHVCVCVCVCDSKGNTCKCTEAKIVLLNFPIQHQGTHESTTALYNNNRRCHISEDQRF